MGFQGTEDRPLDNKASLWWALDGECDTGACQGLTSDSDVQVREGGPAGGPDGSRRNYPGDGGKQAGAEGLGVEADYGGQPTLGKDDPSPHIRRDVGGGTIPKSVKHWGYWLTGHTEFVVTPKGPLIRAGYEYPPFTIKRPDGSRVDIVEIEEWLTVEKKELGVSANLPTS